MAMLPVVIRRRGRLLAALALAALALLLLAGPPVGAQTTNDYDTDNDRLIEIDSPAKLNAIRHDEDGDGDASHADYTAVFPTPSTTQCDDPATTGTTETCAGYELAADLDLATDYPTWTPIGNPYDTTFDGKGYTISGLNVSVAGYAGLFGRIGGSGIIRNVGVLNPTVTATANSNAGGGLAGQLANNGRIETSYVLGGTISATGTPAWIGGLLGESNGSNSVIQATYANATLTTTNTAVRMGGLIGGMNGGNLTNSYAYGVVSSTNSGNTRGGLIGFGGPDASVADSYCNSDTHTQSSCIGGQSSFFTGTVDGKTTGELRQPTGYAGTIYASWSANDPWDFGKRRDYPLLKIDKDGDGTATWEEFGGQYRYIPPPPKPPPYNWRADHPEIYQNPRHQMATSCEVRTTGEGDDAVSNSTLTFDLGSYTRPITLALSLWDGTHFRSLQSQGINMPELRQEGRMATVEVVTDPAQTRFRLDSQYGLNLVLGYADCHTDDP